MEEKDIIEFDPEDKEEEEEEEIEADPNTLQIKVHEDVKTDTKFG